MNSYVYFLSFCYFSSYSLYFISFSKAYRFIFYNYLSSFYLASLSWSCISNSRCLFSLFSYSLSFFSSSSLSNNFSLFFCSSFSSISLFIFCLISSIAFSSYCRRFALCIYLYWFSIYKFFMISLFSYEIRASFVFLWNFYPDIEAFLILDSSFFDSSFIKVSLLFKVCWISLRFYIILSYALGSLVADLFALYFWVWTSLSLVVLMRFWSKISFLFFSF